MDELCERLGVRTRTDIVRLAVRRLATTEGVDIDAVAAKIKRRSPPPKGGRPGGSVPR